MPRKKAAAAPAPSPEAAGAPAADTPPAKPKRTRAKKKKVAEDLSPAEARERSIFLAATGVELRAVRQFKSNRWAAITDNGMTCGVSREDAIAKAIDRNKPS